MDNKDSEQLNIQVRNQVIQERSLIKAEENTTFIFKTIFCCFASSLFMQLITLIPNSYRLINQLPIIISLLLIGVSGVLVVVNKAPNVKAYLLVIAVCFGLLMGA
jgi:Na+-transporting NADH:ubiquinone oxidoreductase subunit NqrD